MIHEYINCRPNSIICVKEQRLHNQKWTMNILASIEKKAKKSLNKKIIVDKQVLIDKLDENKNLTTELGQIKRVKHEMEKEAKLYKEKFQHLKTSTDRERTERNKGFN